MKGLSIGRAEGFRTGAFTQVCACLTRTRSYMHAYEAFMDAGRRATLAAGRVAVHREELALQDVAYLVNRLRALARHFGLTGRGGRGHDAEAIARPHVAVSRETHADLLPAQMLDVLSIERRTKAWQQIIEKSPGADHTAVFVVEDADDAIVGFGLLFLRNAARSWRKKG